MRLLLFAVSDPYHCSYLMQTLSEHWWSIILPKHLYWKLMIYPSENGTLSAAVKKIHMLWIHTYDKLTVNKQGSFGFLEYSAGFTWTRHCRRVNTIPLKVNSIWIYLISLYFSGYSRVLQSIVFLATTDLKLRITITSFNRLGWLRK